MLLLHIQSFSYLMDLRITFGTRLQFLPHFLYLYKLVGPVEGQADHSRFLTDRLQDGLAYPPNRVRNEMITLGDIKALDRVHQANVAFTDQIGQGQSLILVLLGHIHDEA